MKNKKSLNPIPPTMRGKKRYVRFALICDSSLNEPDVWQALQETTFSLFGDFGSAWQKQWPIRWDRKKNEGIFRCSLEGLDGAKLCVLFLQNIAGKKVIPVILLVSGSVGKLKT